MNIVVQHRKIINPIFDSLFAAFTREAAHVRSMVRFTFLRPGDILLSLFPQAVMMQRPLLRELVKLGLFLLCILQGKLVGAKLVWYVNNVCNHDGAFPRLERLWMRIFIRLCDGIIHMSEESRRQVNALYPEAGAVMNAVVPHPNFRAAFTSIGDVARGRALAGAASGERIIFAFGLLRRYKGHESLIDAFRRAEVSHARLVIGGAPYDEETSKDIFVHAGGDPRITLIVRPLPEQEVADLFAAASLFCLPAREILNSGTVILALTLGCPVIAPDLGSMREVASVAGPSHMSLFDGAIEPDFLRERINWGSRARQRPAPDLTSWDVDVVARQMLAALSTMSEGRRASPRRLRSN